MPEPVKMGWQASPANLFCDLRQNPAMPASAARPGCPQKIEGVAPTLTFWVRLRACDMAWPCSRSSATRAALQVTFEGGPSSSTVAFHKSLAPPFPGARNCRYEGIPKSLKPRGVPDNRVTIALRGVCCKQNETPSETALTRASTL